MHVSTPTLGPTRPTRHIGFRLAFAAVLGLAWPALAVTPALAADTTPPTLTAPVAVPQGGGTVGTTNPFRVTWSGSDGGTGIAGYRLAVSVDGGTYAPVALASATSRSAVVRLRAPHEAQLRVRAVTVTARPRAAGGFEPHRYPATTITSRPAPPRTSPTSVRAPA